MVAVVAWVSMHPSKQGLVLPVLGPEIYISHSNPQPKVSKHTQICYTRYRNRELYQVDCKRATRQGDISSDLIRSA